MLDCVHFPQEITENTNITGQFDGHTGITGKCNHFTEVKENKAVLHYMSRILNMNVRHEYEYPYSHIHNTVRTSSY